MGRLSGDIGDREIACRDLIFASDRDRRSRLSGGPTGRRGGQCGVERPQRHVVLRAQLFDQPANRQASAPRPRCASRAHRSPSGLVLDRHALARVDQHRHARLGDDLLVGPLQRLQKKHDRPRDRRQPQRRQQHRSPSRCSAIALAAILPGDEQHGQHRDDRDARPQQPRIVERFEPAQPIRHDVAGRREHEAVRASAAHAALLARGRMVARRDGKQLLDDQRREQRVEQRIGQPRACEPVVASR